MATEDYKKTMQELYTNYVYLCTLQEKGVSFSFRDYVENYWRFEEYHYTSTEIPSEPVEDELNDELQ
jgi:hypothetical protein